MSFDKIILLVSFVFFLPSCSHESSKSKHKRSLASVTREQSSSAVSFGEIVVRIDGVPFKGDIRVNFADGQVYTPTRSGKLVTYLNPGTNKILKINLAQTDFDYRFSNLGISTGPIGSKTYFGTIVVEIKNPSKNSPDPFVRWKWKVDNNWNLTWKDWKKTFGDGFSKAYFSLAEKLGPVNLDEQSRGIATDRQAVETGF